MTHMGDEDLPGVVHHEMNPPLAVLEAVIIRRRLFTICTALAVSLVAATSASASSYKVSSLNGSQTASRSHTGSCSTASGHYKDVLLSCGSSTGRATVTYAFQVPSNAGSIVFYPVVMPGSRGSVSTHTSRTGTNVKVTVTVKGAHAHVDIASTWIGYYVHSTT